PHHAARPAGRLRAEFTHLDGSLQFNQDRTVTWSFAARENTDQAVSVAALGSFEPPSNRLYLRVSADRAQTLLANRFLPPGTETLAGLATGQLTLLQERIAGGKLRTDYQADVNVAGGALRTTRLAEPVTGINGAATITPGVMTAKLD